MKKILTLSFVSVLVLGLVAAGCGSSDNTSSTSAATALTKAEFLKQGNTICKTGTGAINTAAKALGQSPTKAQITVFVNDTVIPSVQTQITGLEALTPPVGDEATVAAILAAANDGLAKVKSDPGAITASDPFAKANQLSKAYGLTVCGS